MRCISDYKQRAVQYPPTTKTAMETATKICKHCGVEKPLSEFHRVSRNKDGINDWCKDCVNEYQRKREAEKRKKRLHEKELALHGNPELAKFQPRELIAELRARGYTGTLNYIQKITV